MAQLAIPLNPTAVRTRALWVPREHGAWGMLFVPMVTGAFVATGSGYAALGWFTLSALSLFWLRTPVESLLGTSVIRVRTADERRAAMTAIAIIGGIALLALTALFWASEHLGLIVVGAIAGLAFVIQALIKRNRKFRALAQIIGSIGLTSTAASAYYLVSGKLNVVAFLLWAINWLFAAEQIEFVQLRIRGSKLTTLDERLRRGTMYIATLVAIVCAIVMVAVAKLVPALAIIAFTPAILRSALWFTSRQTSLHVHKLGWMELGNSVLFATILILALRVA